MPRKFFLSWMCSSATMFLLSFIWHGLILTDFSRLNYSHKKYFIFAAIVYLLLGYVMVKLNNFKYLSGRYKRRPLLKGIAVGIICGVAFFAVATFIGISFKTATMFKNILLDLGWQIAEQVTGGIVIALGYMYFYESNEFADD